MLLFPPAPNTQRGSRGNVDIIVHLCPVLVHQGKGVSSPRPYPIDDASYRGSPTPQHLMVHTPCTTPSRTDRQRQTQADRQTDKTTRQTNRQTNKNTKQETLCTRSNVMDSRVFPPGVNVFFVHVLSGKPNFYWHWGITPSRNNNLYASRLHPFCPNSPNFDWP